ncbi:MAG: PqqD family protein [Acidobacteriota bacterium]|nr:PqqD family protein [Acidobacteriota bacterium]
MLPPGSRTVRRAPQVRWRQFGSDGVLLDPASGEYLQVDAVGVVVWECLELPITIDELVQRLSEEFDESIERVEPDVREFIDALARQQFLLVDPS